VTQSQNPLAYVVWGQVGNGPRGPHLELSTKDAKCQQDLGGREDAFGKGLAGDGAAPFGEDMRLHITRCTPLPKGPSMPRMEPTATNLDHDVVQNFSHNATDHFSEGSSARKGPAAEKEVLTLADCERSLRSGVTLKVERTLLYRRIFDPWINATLESSG
jgi:hypothetical protein